MKESGKITRLLDMGFISGLMGENTLDIGKAISWMNLVFILGKMVECMKDSIKKIKNMDMAFIHGLIRRSMPVGGVEANNTVLEFLSQKKGKES